MAEASYEKAVEDVDDVLPPPPEACVEGRTVELCDPPEHAARIAAAASGNA
jgi:hypothetical protein